MRKPLPPEAKARRQEAVRRYRAKHAKSEAYLERNRQQNRKYYVRHIETRKRTVREYLAEKRAVLYNTVACLYDGAEWNLDPLHLLIEQEDYEEACA